MKPADLIPLVLLALVFWFLIVRPMLARQKQFAAQRQMQSGLKVGDRVMLTSGMYGTVSELEDDSETIGLEIAPDTVVTVARAAVAEAVE